MTTVHEAYCKAYEACQRARDKGRRNIALRQRGDGGFLLAAVRSSRGATCYDFGFGIADWAQNVLYRLVTECLVDFDRADIDAYLKELGRTGYKKGE